MKKNILIVASFVVVLILAFVYYQFSKSHVDMASAKPIAILISDDLFAEFDNDENEANRLYLGKIIQVSGTIYSLEKSDKGDVNVLLMGDDDMFGITCNFDENKLDSTRLNKGENVMIKGECAGMLSDVVLIRCVIVN